MNIIISTVQRPNKTPYLDRLITSIKQDYDGPIHLVIGGKDYSYTDQYQNGFIKHYIGDEEKGNTIQKASYGYCKCLTIDRDIPALIFEDDGKLAEGWYEKFKTLLTFTGEDQFILSLISPSRESVLQPDIDVPSIQKYVYRNFLTYGNKGELPVATIITYSNTTGIYYPVSILQTRLPEFIYKFAVEGEAVYDIVVGQYMFRYNLPIYIAVPNLLEGVDTKDSSLGSVKKMSHIDYTGWNFTKL